MLKRLFIRPSGWVCEGTLNGQTASISWGTRHIPRSYPLTVGGEIYWLTHPCTAYMGKQLIWHALRDLEHCRIRDVIASIHPHQWPIFQAVGFEKATENTLLLPWNEKKQGFTVSRTL